MRISLRSVDWIYLHLITVIVVCGFGIVGSVDNNKKRYEAATGSDHRPSALRADVPSTRSRRRSTSKGLSRSQLLELLLNTAKTGDQDVKNTPPNYNSDTATDIEVMLYVDSIDSINEANMDFTLSVLLHLQWKDSRLVSFNIGPSFGNLTFLEFDSQSIQRIWVPDIFFPNEKRASFHDVMMANQMMRLYRDGLILYISRLSMTLSCPMNLRYYPFDKQSCSVQIMSFGYAEDKLNLKWMNSTNSDAVVVNDIVELPQFEVTGSEPNRCRKKYHQSVHSCLQANFFLARNIGYYVVQMYIPSILIVMLSWISFWLTVNSVPGRISLGVLTVLTMTTQSSGVNASLPRVSYTKAIDVWMSTCLVFVFAALLEFAIVNVLSRKETLSGFTIRNVFSIPRDFEKGDQLKEQSSPLDGGPRRESFSTKRQGKRGIVYAMYLDVASRIGFPVAFLLFIMVYWLYYINVE
ncbi:glycine receptor subunit alpha-1-like isoform X2 [Haliotis cracherodii]|uniref:glycine receptor subunit alpha-1-like isoform X2 n=1 Tax=Haliotis rufescens TaxID=6454 RepID=UPI001EB013DF|nr:glycine receptor subunit alpha-1-like isoform X2 [Haliotis rufescens]